MASTGVTVEALLGRSGLLMTDHLASRALRAVADSSFYPGDALFQRVGFSFGLLMAEASAGYFVG